MEAVFVTKVTGKGTTTIPESYRRKFGINPKGMVEWRNEGERLVVKPVHHVDNPLEKLLQTNLHSKKSAVQLVRQAREEFW